MFILIGLWPATFLTFKVLDMKNLNEEQFIMWVAHQLIHKQMTDYRCSEANGFVFDGKMLTGDWLHFRINATGFSRMQFVHGRRVKIVIRYALHIEVNGVTAMSSSDGTFKISDEVEGAMIVIHKLCEKREMKMRQSGYDLIAAEVETFQNEVK